MSNIEIKGANTFPTLHFSGGLQTIAGSGAHFWKSVSEDVSIIHWVADLCGFIRCILKALRGTGKRKMVYVTAINWGPLSLFLPEYTQTATVKGIVLCMKTRICRKGNTKALLKNAVDASALHPQYLLNLLYGNRTKVWRTDRGKEWEREKVRVDIIQPR